MSASPVLTSDEAGHKAEALWRALNYLCVVQLYLTNNVLMRRPLLPEDIKTDPRGHWGTCPGVNWVLAHIHLAQATGWDLELVPVIGAGHAGICQIAIAWLNESLPQVQPALTRDVNGLTRLAQAFPDVPRIGAEVSPLLWGGSYVGGQLGSALAFSCGAALDEKGKVFVPIVGDGECETGTTSGAWLGAKALGLDGASHGLVLPVLWLNGQRMGGPSLLSSLDHDQLCRYFAGLGWDAEIVSVRGALSEHVDFQKLLHRQLAMGLDRRRSIVVLMMPKGWTGPAQIGAQDLLETPRMHKAPLRNPHQDPLERAALQDWLSRYRPAELFASDGSPIGWLAAALTARPLPQMACRVTARSRPTKTKGSWREFGPAVTDVLRHHSETGDLGVFSPDELESNRLGGIAHESWAHELLDEQVCLAWLLGYISTGRRAVLISYEAFAALLLTPLIQHLKQRRIGRQSRFPNPSVNLLLTSLGWHNTYTHGDPSLITGLLGTEDPALHILCPGDAQRVAVTLDRVLDSREELNVIVASKHAFDLLPGDTIDQELTRGIAIWPAVSDSSPVDLVFVSCGDLPARQLMAAAIRLRSAFRTRIRHVHIQDLTVLGDPAVWPAALSVDEFEHYFGVQTPLLIGTIGHPAAIWGLLAGRLEGRRASVVGWREPAGPTAVQLLLEHAGMTPDRLAAAAAQLWRSATHYRERAFA